MSLVTQGAGRYDESIEDAVFFTCREALQNTIKHAPSATGVMLTLIDDGSRLEFSVVDNGRGSTRPCPGTGPRRCTIAPRLLGGSLTITSSPGVGSLSR